MYVAREHIPQDTIKARFRRRTFYVPNLTSAELKRTQWKHRDKDGG